MRQMCSAAANPSSMMNEVEKAWWHSMDPGLIRNYRKCMLRTLASILMRQAKRPSSQLPLICRRLEEQLLKSSESLVAYLDKNSLKDRLRTIAKRAKEKSKLNQDDVLKNDDKDKLVDKAVSLLDTMPRDAVALHIKSVKSDIIKEYGLRALENATKNHKLAWIFSEPVDPIKLGLSDYFQVIQHPMDLGTIRKRLEQFEYYDLDQIESDVSLTFSNAILYNGAQSDIGKAAKELNDAIIRCIHDEKNLLLQDNPKSDGRCRLCHRGHLPLTPLAYRCDGPGCEGQRIRRGAPSFFDPVGRRRYCRTCLEKQQFNIDKFIREKAGDDDDAEEPWVQCSRCDSWVHQVCALFNGRANHSDVIYICPYCWKQQDTDNICKVDNTDEKKISSQKWRVAELPTTPLSIALESRLSTLMKSFMVPGEQNEPSHLLVREVSNIIEEHSIKPRFLEHVKPTVKTIQTRSRCITLFQTIDGVDVVLLCMYVYEYEQPGSNERRLYLSYLDSVNFLRPKHARTAVYHELLVGYLGDAKRRGFHTAHIWACPPKRGDDYIFNVKPKYQRTPSDDRLRKWYNAALEKAKNEGIVVNITTFWDDLLAPLVSETESNNNDQFLTSLPYFDGDWWCSEVERLLEADAKAKQAAEQEAARADDDADTVSGYTSTKSGSPNSASSRKPPKKKRKKLTTARQRTVIEPPSVISRLAKTMQLMKDSFLVAHLEPRSYIESTGETEIKHEDASEEGSDELKHCPSQESMPKVSPPPSPTINAASKMDMNENLADEHKHEEESNVCATTSAICTNKSVSSDILCSRQHFLDVCQGNHYQFDELRRAKHSTMMVLYHMHNPEAPLFPSSCARCGIEIGDGARSPTHAICRSCQQKAHAEPRGIRVRRLSARAAAAVADKSYGRSVPPIVLSRAATFGTRSSMAAIAQHQQEEQQKAHPEAKERADKARILNSLLRLLDHATVCDKSECPVTQCANMKQQILHLKNCGIPNRHNDCRDCRRIYSLLQFHARSCRHPQCPVFLCDAFKKRVAQATNALAAATTTTEVADATPTTNDAGG
mmetsp:Transcript_20836/g.26993  ORF Transcript_20836/g.26993 Transcript_20836/m.26993 type:complete len:1056 (+) Transcript_20836:177-3344(+)